MEQLKMTRAPGPAAAIPLPEGYEYEYYAGLPGQVGDWLRICKEGLLEPGADAAVFKAAIEDYPDLDPLKDLVFVKTTGGERVATSAFVLHKDGRGYIHMVCCLVEHRGRGIGRAMISLALTKLWERGAGPAFLTTDDFRLPAIKTYLEAGFLPDANTEEMKERWRKVFAELGVEGL